MTEHQPRLAFSKTRHFEISRYIDPVVLYLKQEHRLLQGQTTAIPLNSKESILYTKNERGWITNRNVHFYNALLFSDQYEYFRDQRNRFRSKLKSNPETILGGQKNAFADGKVVLELGSGQAFGLLQYSRLYPNTHFIGVDNGYAPEAKFTNNPKRIQLVHENWDTLASFADNSIDTILSLQGGFTHGISENNERKIPLIDAISRIAKKGALLRYDDIIKMEEELIAAEYLQKKGWAIIPCTLGNVCIKL